MKNNKWSKKETRKFIIENRREGKSDQEIYFEIRQNSKDRYDIANLIINTPTDDALLKFKGLRYLLMALVILGAPLFLFLSYADAKPSYSADIAMSTVYIGYSFHSFYELYRGYDGNALTLLPLITTPFIFASRITSNDYSFMAIWISYVICLTVLSFYLMGKLLPKKRLIQEIKKDENGEYIV